MGEVIEFKMPSGHKLTVTPNHPILTSVGWKRACEINELDQLVENTVINGLGVADVDVEGGNAEVGKLYDSLLKSGGAYGVSSGVVDFHGDRPNTDVEVVDVAWTLMDGTKAKVKTSRINKFFELTESAGCPLVSDSSLDKFLSASLLSSDSFVSLTGDFGKFLGSCFTESELVGFASGSRIDVKVSEAGKNNTSADSELLGHCKYRNAILEHLFDWFMELNSIGKMCRFSPASSIAVTHYDGPVYNVEDVDSIYSASTIINHNCRCVVNYAPAEQMAELREEAEQREADIQEELDFDDDAFVEPDL